MNKFIISCTFAATALCVSSMNQSCNAMDSLEKIAYIIDQHIPDTKTAQSIYEDISKANFKKPVTNSIGFSSATALSTLRSFTIKNPDLTAKIPLLITTFISEFIDRLIETTEEDEKTCLSIKWISNSIKTIRTNIYSYLQPVDAPKKATCPQKQSLGLNEYLKTCEFSGIKSMPLIKASAALGAMNQKKLDEIIRETIYKIAHANLTSEEEISLVKLFKESGTTIKKIKEKRFQIIEAIMGELSPESQRTFGVMVKVFLF